MTPKGLIRMFDLTGNLSNGETPDFVAGRKTFERQNKNGFGVLAGNQRPGISTLWALPAEGPPYAKGRPARRSTSQSEPKMRAKSASARAIGRASSTLCEDASCRANGRHWTRHTHRDVAKSLVFSIRSVGCRLIRAICPSCLCGGGWALPPGYPGVEKASSGRLD